MFPEKIDSSRKPKPQLSESPPKNYLKKSDIPHMEEIKMRLGKSEEMLEIRQKYKGKNPSVQFLSKVPMYQRQGYMTSKGTRDLIKDLEEKRKELKEKAKPLNYEELKEHQLRVDRLKSERVSNHSAFVSQPALSLDDSLIAVEEGSAMKIAKDARKEFLRRREMAKQVTGLDKKVPSHLLHYKFQLNPWAQTQKRAKEILALRKEKGEEYCKKFKEKIEARRKSSGVIDKNKSQVTLKIDTVGDLDKLNKSTGTRARATTSESARTPFAERELVSHRGNQYFSDTNKKYNSQNALKHLLGTKRTLSNRDGVGKAMQVSSLLEHRAERANQIAELYNKSQARVKFAIDNADLAADQWTKAIETKINALDFIESQMKGKGQKKDKDKIEPVKLPPIVNDAKSPKEPQKT